MKMHESDKENALPISVFVHIVTFNSAQYIRGCIDAVLGQRSVEGVSSLQVLVTDNASSDGTADLLESEFGQRITVIRSRENLGFCGGQNLGVKRFLQSTAGFLLVLNPDLRLEKNALRALASAADIDAACGFATPKLLRCDEELQPLDPPIIDAAGMILNSSLRHLDRASGELDDGSFSSAEYVFGGTGACLLLKRDFVEDMLIDDSPFSAIPSDLYPALVEGRQQRAQLFDEAFFAYREDADLAWRAKGTKWNCLYVPEARGYHKRVVTPERRGELDPALNLHSVRNRFLMQVNNFSFSRDWKAIVPGLLIRNLMVILGVMLYENSSIPAFWQFLHLMPRALRIRRQNMTRNNKILQRQGH